MAGGSIKLFRITRKFCQTVGIYPLKPNQNRYHINSKNWLTLFCINQYLISTIAFLLFEADSMAEYGMIFYVCSVIFECIIFCLAAFWQAENISKFVGNWEQFIEKRVNSRILYKGANEKIEQFTGWYTYCALATVFFLAFPVLIYTYVNYYALNSGEISFFLVAPAWFVLNKQFQWPFDWKTPLGYFVAWLGQCTGITALCLILLPFCCFVLGSSLLFIFMAEDIKKDLTAFNRTLKTSEDHASDRVELMKRFCATIQIYSDAKQCVKEFNAIYECPLFMFFSQTMLGISSSLMTLQFQLVEYSTRLIWDDDSKLLDFFNTSMLIFWSYAYNFLICELGERVTQGFEMFGEELEQFDWHKLPINMQRMYLIFLSDTQQPIYVQSFGGILCSRETFKKVTNTSWSYFMTLRQFEA